MSKSHLTAITRKVLPTPIRWLIHSGELIRGKVLDYGCGKCANLNDKFLTQVSGVQSVTNFDPYYLPNKLLLDRYDTILCTYVLCAVEEEAEAVILKKIRNLLSETGLAFITVRNDTPKQGYGISSRGTYQRRVELPQLRMFHQSSQFRIYLLTKNMIRV